jgi:ribosomal protein L31E
MKKSELRQLIREEIKRTLNEDKEVILSNEILNFLEERGMIDPSDAQKVHKDLTSFLKSKNIQ